MGSLCGNSFCCGAARKRAVRRSTLAPVLSAGLQLANPQPSDGYCAACAELHAGTTGAQRAAAGRGVSAKLSEEMVQCSFVYRLQVTPKSMKCLGMIYRGLRKLPECCWRSQKNSLATTELAWRTPDSLSRQPCNRSKLQGSLASLLEVFQALRPALAGLWSSACLVHTELGSRSKWFQWGPGPPAALLGRACFRHVHLLVVHSSAEKLDSTQLERLSGENALRVGLVWRLRCTSLAPVQ